MSDLLSPFELKHLRKAIGASVSRMAELLGLSGDNASDQVRKMENGSKTISGPIQRLARFMQEGVTLGDDMDRVLPRFMTCGDLTPVGGIEYDWVFHTRYPRFLAVSLDNPVEGLTCFTADNIDWLCVAMWIDEPVDDDVSVLLEECAELFANYSEYAVDNTDDQE